MYSKGLVRPYGGAGGEYIQGSFRLTVWWGVISYAISRGYVSHKVSHVYDIRVECIHKVRWEMIYVYICLRDMLSILYGDACG